MEKRIDYKRTSPEGVQIMIEMEKHLSTASIEPKLKELIKVRASQMNGCAYCLNMHTADARTLGETEQRLYCVSAWRESTFYSDAEKAALELTEYITLIAEKRVPDDVYQRVRAHYDEKQYVALVMLINQINSWNRLSIAMGNTAD